MFTLQQLLDAGLPATSTDGNGAIAETQFSRPLTPAEWQTYLTIASPSQARHDAAKVTARSIPNWATWTQTQLQAWWDANLADSIVDGFSIPAGVKAMLKAQNAAILRIGQMEIALRDRVFPDLPE